MKLILRLEMTPDSWMDVATEIKPIELEGLPSPLLIRQYIEPMIAELRHRFTVMTLTAHAANQVKPAEPA